MPPIDYSVLRACFKNFLGEEPYRKFLAAGVGFELLFWQERAWERFADAYPQFRMTDSERLEALGVCPAHERPMHIGYTASTEGINFRPRSPEEVLLFPRAPFLPLQAEGGVRRVRYCPVCVDVAAAARI